MRSFLCRLTLLLAAATSLVAQTNNRQAAIQRALNFLQTTASNDTAFADYGDDFMWCFYTIAHTARDPKLRVAAARMARVAALKWRKAHAHVPANADADTIASLVGAAYTADLLGAPDPRFKAELRRAALRFGARDYLGFDAVHEPPPPDDPHRYKLWHEALITTLFGDAYGIYLGAHYADVVQWLPRLRPYQTNNDSLEFDMFYAVTHLVYTLDGYNSRRIDPALLPEEVAFLKRKLAKSIEEDDPEMVGEALDCLKAFGLDSDPLVRQGTEYLLANQLPSGEWVSAEDRDVYTAYHSAWTGLDGLRDYRFLGTVRNLPRLVPGCAHPPHCAANCF